MKTIVVVDDELSIAEVLAAILEDAGYRICTASDGLAGLACIQAERPDLIVSDVMMPRMDGYALARTVQADPDLRHTPVVLMSAGANPPAHAHFAFFVRKPFDINTILSVVESTIGPATP